MSKLIVTLAAAIIFAEPLFAEETRRHVYSYTMEEMYSMATHYKALARGENFDDIRHYMDAAEFRGYVGAALDQVSEKYDDMHQCVQRMRVTDIAQRVASLVTSVELDRSMMSPISVHTGIRVACDKSYWDSNG